MRVFVTGATGFIGTAVVKELIAADHKVIGLCRSEEKAAALAATGAEVQRGSVQDLGSLEAGIARSDGVIHLAFNHDFSKFVQNCEDDRRVIRSIGSMLRGSNRPFIVTSGTAIANIVLGKLATEDSPTISASVNPRAASEEEATSVLAQGINVSVVRLPQVHDTARQGLITWLIGLAREKGFCAYIGDGHARWAAAPIPDVARLYKLALEKAEPGARWHAVAEEGVRLRDIAEAIGRRLRIPVKSITSDEAPAYFGWLAPFANHDMPASSEQTRKRLGWRPVGRGLIADLDELQV